MRGAIGWALMAGLLTSTAWAEENPPGSDPAVAAETPPQTACVPACRNGFVCIDARCVTACNPPCAEGERCTAQAECERMAESAPSDTPPGDSEPSVERSGSDSSWQTRGTRRNTGMMVTGIVATSIGGLLALSGGMFLLMGDTTKCTTYDDGEVSCTGENYTRLGAGLAIGGTVLLAIGIPMVLVGASPRSRRVTSRASSQVTASVVVGGQSLLLRGTW